jgi:hypothetical protein
MQVLLTPPPLIAATSYGARWEKRAAGGDWERDFDLAYTRQSR